MILIIFKKFIFNLNVYSFYQNICRYLNYDTIYFSELLGDLINILDKQIKAKVMRSKIQHIR